MQGHTAQNTGSCIWCPQPCKDCGRWPRGQPQSFLAYCMQLHCACLSWGSPVLFTQYNWCPTFPSFLGGGVFSNHLALYHPNVLTPPSLCLGHSVLICWHFLGRFDSYVVFLYTSHFGHLLPQEGFQDPPTRPSPVLFLYAARALSFLYRGVHQPGLSVSPSCLYPTGL